MARETMLYTRYLHLRGSVKRTGSTRSGFQHRHAVPSHHAEETRAVFGYFHVNEQSSPLPYSHTSSSRRVAGSACPTRAKGRLCSHWNKCFDSLLTRHVVQSVFLSPPSEPCHSGRLFFVL
jgi:hypothetical protein